MRVFVTGATGFLGFAIVENLIAAGHEVTGLARSDASAKKLTEVGAKVLRGDIEQLAVLRQGAAAADGVIHTAFYHQVSHIPLPTRLRVFLGGLPTGIFDRFFKAAIDADRRALETLGGALRAGSPLVGTFATTAMKPGVLATEDQPIDPASPGGTRGATEKVMLGLAAKGVRACIVRLPPVVHGGADRNGFLPRLIQIARKKKESAYVGNGANRWCTVHKQDAAHLFRLVLENGKPGAAYHAVAEEGIPFRTVAEMIGAGLNLPAVSTTPQQAAERFSFLAPFIPADNPTSSALTRERLGWEPTHPNLQADMIESRYFAS